MNSNSDLVSWFFILLSLAVGLSYIGLVLNKPETTVTQNLPAPTYQPTSNQPIKEPVPFGTFQTWQCFSNEQGGQKCVDVFNNQGLPFSSNYKPTIQKKLSHVPVWKCNSNSCVDVYNFVGQAF
jgi:hypothetical protein